MPRNLNFLFSTFKTKQLLLPCPNNLNEYRVLFFCYYWIYSNHERTIRSVRQVYLQMKKQLAIVSTYIIDNFECIQDKISCDTQFLQLTSVELRMHWSLPWTIGLATDERSIWERGKTRLSHGRCRPNGRRSFTVYIRVHSRQFTCVLATQR